MAEWHGAWLRSTKARDVSFDDDIVRKATLMDGAGIVSESVLSCAF